MTKVLYNVDKAGNVRIWWMEQEGNKHRTHHGVQGGAITCSGWTECSGKQGRNDREQAEFEIAAGYTYQLKRTYFETVEEARKGPRFFEPMLAVKFKDLGYDKARAFVEGHPKSGNYTLGVEPKFDGFCNITQLDGMTSREGQPIVAVPHINLALAPFFAQFREAVLHGELYNHDFADDFESLSSILKKQTPAAEDLERSKVMKYYIYDYPAPDLVNLPLSERKILLKMDMMQVYPTGWTEMDNCPGVENKALGIVLVGIDWVGDEATVEDLRKVHVKNNFEGAMVKMDMPYEIGTRSKHNMKHKVTLDGEFKIVRIREGKGNYAGLAKAVDLVDAEGREFSAGIKGDKTRLKTLLETGGMFKLAGIEYLRLTKRGVPKGGVATKWYTEERTL